MELKTSVIDTKKHDPRNLDQLVKAVRLRQANNSVWFRANIGEGLFAVQLADGRWFIWDDTLMTLVKHDDSAHAEKFVVWIDSIGVHSRLRIDKSSLTPEDEEEVEVEVFEAEENEDDDEYPHSHDA